MLNRSSLKDQALAVIRQRMVSGEIRPGEIQSAASMAARLGTSNGPVREAMLTLVEQGIMEVVPNRGFRVVPFSEEDLREVVELRVMLEVPAMGRLARVGLGDAADLVREHARRCDAAARRLDLTEFLAADRDFHLSLLQALGNTRLLRIVGQLRDQTRLSGLHSVTVDRLHASAGELVELLDAIVAGDAEAAERVMALHLGHVRGNWAQPAPAHAAR
ncbi:GntR family transcriptional regulator [Georgenia subflava]|uniref:FCD domain-containing protein n=1 Tax=Georgenia subflava TaxID=1622177 RepID=A0A6N7EKB2_9MICO|nr:GntR family transcriptional regulator [Georgenia subflava]MPV38589.1 FCD domain-containing protein [Georgenia subflava]